MKKMLLSLFLLIHLANYSNAKHITGGKMKLTHLGANAFKLQLELERDCGGGGAPFETNVEVALFAKENDFWVNDFVLKRDSIVISPYQYDCFGSSRCFEIGYFSTTILYSPESFYFDSTGYYFYWERCCLIEDFDNIFASGTTPYGIQLDVPKFSPYEYSFLPYPNSSPSSTKIFNPLICLNKEFEFDFSYVDVDGDSLVYKLINPNAGGYTSYSNPGQNNGPKPYENVTWLGIYNKLNPLPTSNFFKLNPQTGILKFNPTQLGKYIFAFEISEYRDGVKIGTVYNESMLFVYDCTSSILEHPKDQYSIDLSPVTFKVKHSDTSVIYQWQIKTPQDTSFSDIANAISDSLVISQVADSMNNYQYRCIMHKSTCNDISLAARLRIKGLGIENKNSNKIILYPNPTKNQVSIKGIENPQKISVYSLDGKLLKEIFNALSIDVSDLEPGMYLVRATDEKNNSNYYGKLRVGE